MEGNLFEQLINYYQTNFGYLWELFVNHLLMSVYGVLFRPRWHTVRHLNSESR